MILTKECQNLPTRTLIYTESPIACCGKKNMFSTGYPKENIIFVKGMVEDTIPRTLPNQIALLRLDTDLYESTYHELIHLYPKVATQGVVIIDDYGHFQGSQEATDKYFSQESRDVLFHRIDYSCRVGIKPATS